jgi:hypothetical protein
MTIKELIEELKENKKYQDQGNEVLISGKLLK